MLPLEDRALITQTMVGLNIDPETITSLLASFDTVAEELEKEGVREVRSTSYGDSYTGGHRLNTNVDMAATAIHDELTRMANVIRGMYGSVEQLVDDVQTTTDQTTASMTRLHTSTDGIKVHQSPNHSFRANEV